MKGVMEGKQFKYYRAVSAASIRCDPLTWETSACQRSFATPSNSLGARHYSGSDQRAPETANKSGL